MGSMLFAERGLQQAFLREIWKLRRRERAGTQLRGRCQNEDAVPDFSWLIFATFDRTGSKPGRWRLEDGR